MPLATYIAYIWARSTRFSPCSSRGLQGPWRLAAAADEQIERLLVVLQAVARCSWFTSCLGLSDMPLPTATAHLQPRSHIPYTAAEHSILVLQQQGPACPCPVAAATDEQIQRLVVVLQAASHSSWFTSCLGLSDMPIPTPISHFPPQSTRFWRGVFLGFLPSVDHGIKTALSVVR